MIKFMLITNDSAVAQYAEKCGVGRIFVDLERNGKRERQGHLDTLISQHSMDDVSKIKKSINSAQLLVRLNPFYDGSQLEIEGAIRAGAQILMLPMFRTIEEVERFCRMVDGRAEVVPLVETVDAVNVLSDLVQIHGVSEIYIGLNDLHLDMGLKFMFEPLASGLIDQMVEIIKAAGLSYGFGGIARTEEGAIPGEMVLAEHQRLGSSSVILSRTFHRKGESLADFSESSSLEVELRKLRDTEKRLQLRSEADCEKDFLRLKEVVRLVVEK